VRKECPDDPRVLVSAAARRFLVCRCFAKLAFLDSGQTREGRGQRETPSAACVAGQKRCLAF